MLNRPVSTNIQLCFLRRQAGYVKQGKSSTCGKQGETPWTGSEHIQAKFLLLTAQRIANLWAGPMHRPASVPGVLTLTVFAFWGLCRAYPGLTMPQRAGLDRPAGNIPRHLLLRRIYAPVQSTDRLDPVCSCGCNGMEVDRASGEARRRRQGAGVIPLGQQLAEAWGIAPANYARARTPRQERHQRGLRRDPGKDIRGDHAAFGWLGWRADRLA